jgi:precorrin-3B C17-methyltransferase
VVGIGPGGRLDRTHRAEQAIRESEVVVGYKRYLDMIPDLTAGKQRVSSGMTAETERCREALALAARGKRVALVSSGDPGVYGMAGLAIELAEAEKIEVPISIIPGVTAATAAAAALGAPLMLDFACVSLSDLLVPWEEIRTRLEAVGSADLVIALYNPKSTKRTWQLQEAIEIIARHRPASTPAGVVTLAGGDEEQVLITDLGRVGEAEVSMRSIIIIGNKSSRRIGRWFVTPRGYKL